MEANSLGNYDWISDTDKKKKPEKQTIWTLSTLTFEQDCFLEDEIARSAGDGTVMAHILNMGLKGCKNFKFNGKSVVAKRDKESKTEYPGEVKPWTDEFLSRIPKTDRSLMGFQIRYGCAMSQADRKN